MCNYMQSLANTFTRNLSASLPGSLISSRSHLTKYLAKPFKQIPCSIFHEIAGVALAAARITVGTGTTIIEVKLARKGGPSLHTKISERFGRVLYSLGIGWS